MSNKEKAASLLDEYADDVFCEGLVQDYLNNSDTHKHDFVTLEEMKEELGI